MFISHSLPSRFFVFVFFKSLKLKTIVKGDAPTSLASTAGNAKVEVRRKGNTLVIVILLLKVNGLGKRDYFSVRSLCESIVTYFTCDPFKKLSMKTFHASVRFSICHSGTIKLTVLTYILPFCFSHGNRNVYSRISLPKYFVVIRGVRYLLY